jgi:hypothetical protein
MMMTKTIYFQDSFFFFLSSLLKWIQEEKKDTSTTLITSNVSYFFKFRPFSNFDLFFDLRILFLFSISFSILDLFPIFDLLFDFFLFLFLSRDSLEGPPSFPEPSWAALSRISNRDPETEKSEFCKI